MQAYDERCAGCKFCPEAGGPWEGECFHPSATDTYDRQETQHYMRIYGPCGPSALLWEPSENAKEAQ